MRAKIKDSRKPEGNNCFLVYAIERKIIIGFDRPLETERVIEFYFYNDEEERKISLDKALNKAKEIEQWQGDTIEEIIYETSKPETNETKETN